jgi:alkanesulfonate monooxygenase SsuD/methylene tetrahydromethanopterin reductase-like flavin-dependent oxidoreductase (luciferase family)
VVPRPYQNPHPPLFQAHSISSRTIAWCAREGVIPIIQFPLMETCLSCANYYQQVAASVGRELSIGENLGLIRVFHIGQTREAALAASEAYDSLIWGHWYRYFGYLELFRLPGEIGPVPKANERVADRLAASGMSIIGTIDDVKRGVERILNHLPVDYLVWHLAWRPMPTDEAIRQLELFAEHVMPEFGLVFAGDEETAQ